MKAVRDRIPEDKKFDPYGTEFLSMLVAKLHEESREVEEAVAQQFDGERPSEDVIEELGDVIETAYAIAARYGASPGDVDAAREAKLARKGGFDLGRARHV